MTLAFALSPPQSFVPGLAAGSFVIGAARLASLIGLLAAWSTRRPGTRGLTTPSVATASASRCSCGEGAALFVSPGAHHGADCSLYHSAG